MTWSFEYYLAFADLDVQSLALHELGHVIGLGHAKDKSSVMYSFESDMGVLLGYYKRDLGPEDIALLRQLYPSR